MSDKLRLTMTAVRVALVILAIAVGLTRYSADLLAPSHLLVFLIPMALYPAPTALALYRICTAAAWIAALNILLGWTLLGWFIALGWAVGGKASTLPASTYAQWLRSVPGH